jgi:YfiH family protein
MLFLPESELADKVFCFTTSAHGGVSNGVYQSFNLGDHVGDNQDRVATNRHLLQSIITQQVVNRNLANQISDLPALEPIKWLNQGHTTNIIDYDSVDELLGDNTEKPYIDGIDTLSSYTPLAVMTADCLPIVLVCRKTGKIAAVHAGWRGLVENFLAKVITRFEHTDALSVWIGPHISEDKFQISVEIVDYFSLYPNAVKADKQEGKYLVKLAEIARHQLDGLGVKNIQVSPVCTYSNEHCFSHRKSTHLGQTQTGRMATVVIRL